MAKTSMTQHLIDGYRRMLERIQDSIHDWNENARIRSALAIDNAKKMAEELGELTREEAEKVSLYLKRDLQDASQYLQQTGKELASWLAFDWQLIEDRTWDAFVAIANKFKLDYLEFNNQLKLGTPYHTGEITSAGTLYCIECQQAMHFYKVSHIPPCPKCHGTKFIRGRND